MPSGVYRDLISTMRHADTMIPVQLGNLRQEIEAEKIFLRYRMRENDPYSVFPRAFRKHRRKRQAVSQLLSLTIDSIWQEFKNLERPFLIRNPFRAEEVRKGDYWGESDIDEKPRARPDQTNEQKTHDRMGMAEAGLSPDQERYYRTDLVHRYMWWQSRNTVDDMLQQVQRIQIRRIERDAFETDELVKLCLRKLDRQSGRGGRAGSRSGGSSRSDGGGDSGGLRRRSVRSRPGSVRMPSRRGSRSGGRFREVQEREAVRVRSENPARAKDSELSKPEQRYEYEVVQPGRIYVDDSGLGRVPSRRSDHQRESYIADRQERRYRSRER